MAKLTQPEFEFSPEGIAALCTDLPAYHRNMLIDWLEWAWDEADTFEVELEIPTKEKPYAQILNIMVDPVAQQVTIERRFS